MDAMKEIPMNDEDVVRELGVYPKNMERFQLDADKGLTKTEVVARAKARGLRNYKDLATLAIQDDHLKPLLGGLFSRADGDNWIDAELAVDRYEDQFTISLAQARALAKEAGLEGYSAAVLNAITRLEIEGVEYRRGQPRIPVAAFEAWLEDAGSPADAGPVSAELEELLSRDITPTSGEVFAAGVEMYLGPALVALAGIVVLVIVFMNAG